MQATRYAALDPLRGLAAIWVFFFHYPFSPVFQATFPLLHTFMKAGDRAVPMFFVISGYCLAMAASRAAKYDRPIGGFFYRRAKRIFPTFWCSIVLIVLLKYTTWFVAQSLSIAYDFPLIRDWKYWAKVVTLTQMFDQSTGLFFQRFGKVNGPYWTLPIEFQFYLVVGAAMLAPRRFYPILAAVTVAAVPVYFSGHLFFLVAHSGAFLAFWLPFACGLALYWMLDRGMTPDKVLGRHARSASIIGSIVLASAFIVLVTRKVEVERLAFAVGLTVLLWFASPLDGRIGEFLKRKRGVTGLLARCLIVLGAMSYSLYLLHSEVSYAIAFALQHFLPNGVSASEWVIDLSVVLGVFAVCYPFYRYCEAPFVGGRKDREATAPATIIHPSTAQDTIRVKAA